MKRVMFSFLLIVMMIASVTAPQPVQAADITVSSVDFNDGTPGSWFQSGGPVLGYVDDGSGGQALSIARNADYEGIQSPTGLLQPGVLYTFSMRARLPEGSTVASTDVRFVVKPNYNWVGNTTITNTGWTVVTGTYSVPDGVDLAAVQIYIGSSDQTGEYTILIDDILITAPDTGGGSGAVIIETDFESGLDGWALRSGNEGTVGTVSLTETEAHSPTHAVLVSDRDSEGDGVGHDVTGLMETGKAYDISAWVKFAAGSPSGSIWLSMHRVNGSDNSFDTIGQFANITSDGWTEVKASYVMGSADTALLYFETPYQGGNLQPFLVDDILVKEQGAPTWDSTLTPLQDTVDFPVGVAIDSRETTGASSELLLHHFDQVTPENHMKPEAWYDAERNFGIHSEAVAIMDFAQANDLRVYGHTLVWHSQTPAWFFQRDDGTQLTNSPEDQQILRDRLRTHIFNVANTLSDLYGPFGSETNPIVAFDVVNEVISDSAEADGLRRSPYYNILGPSYIDDAFLWAEQAFNVENAAPGADRPVALVINDYNTEHADKRARLLNLVNGLLDRGIPVDVVGHQFHVSLTTPVESLNEALVAFADLPVQQAVTELDVMTGTPADEASIIEQGYYYRDAFDIFRAHTEDIFSVTVWGLIDSRSWRSTNAPLLFDAQLAAKPAYFGAVDQELPARLRTALVFMADVPLDVTATYQTEWQKLRLINVEDKLQFQLRWMPDHLSVFAQVADTTVDPTDQITLTVGEETYTINRDGTGDVEGDVSELAGVGWMALVRLPLSGAAQDDQVDFDIAVTDGAETVAWNDPGALGQLTLVEELSYLEVAGIGGGSAPVIDGALDAVWSLAGTVTTAKQTTGTDSASADVKTLWQGDTLYVYMHVHDDVLDATASDPWQKDSVEIYVDAGNYKNGAYRPEDTQIRINYLNEVSFGTGDTAAQAARLVSATQVVDDGYVVEASINLLDESGVNTYHGLDFQVNDAAGGARVGIRNWADPTNAGYLSTAHWGVGKLLAADTTIPKLTVKYPILNLTATSSEGYAGLTAAIAGVTAQDAFDDPSWLTITYNGPEVLPVGRSVITWVVTDLSGNSATRRQTVYVHRQVPTSITYTGKPTVVLSSRQFKTYTMSAILSSEERAWYCTVGAPVTFSLDRDPVTGNTDQPLTLTGYTLWNGKTSRIVSVRDWQPGEYTLTVTYAGNDFGCLGSSTTVTLNVVADNSKLPKGTTVGALLILAPLLLFKKLLP